MKKIEISIVMSTYKDGEYLKSAIDSVLQQTSKNWELIIINDNSPDNTDEIIKSYMKNDKRIIYRKNKDNMGLIHNLNLGLELARADLVARIDSDDIWLDLNKLEKQKKYLDTHPECGLLGSFSIAIDNTGQKLFDINFPTEHISIYKNMLLKNCFTHSSVIFRKSLANIVGKYDVNHKYVEDYGLWLKLGRISRVENLPEYLVGYRVNKQGITQTKYTEQINTLLGLIESHKDYYPNYTQALLIWKLRLLYPRWFSETVSNKLKNILLQS